ncbi:hypothetical protein DL990_28685 [Amycolatopsis sp. WAC 01416]|uniref:Shedu immune nuclease family protein n=1 Tax=Amycolatopsis sp. WAC 01416 TaxID=2203196 RepID=UPI000F78A004|nr:Shedu immune nuclease family protein [Amycolatopsis sp. WAC 01416]RSN28627.1 hypothetical protein DL990_28685 [Amycolatopsis sp. WAC 01416]
MTEEYVTVRSTSNVSADVHPLPLRQSERTRLVFIPTLVDNENDPQSPVKATFAYQKKKTEDAWEAETAINLASLHSGEGVKLALSAEETAKLYMYLQALYDLHDARGIRNGRRRYLLVDTEKPMAQALEKLQSSSSAESISAAFDWFAAQDEDVLTKYFKSSPGEVLSSLDKALGISRIERFIERAKALMSSDNESAWQTLLQEENWAVSQVFADPVVIVGEKVYVGGKDYTRKKGNEADFLYRREISDDCLIVEIKTPKTPLLYTKKEYRNRVYNIDKELAGATQQIRQYSYSLSESYRQIADQDDPEFRAFAPRLLLIIGSSSSLENVTQKRSFEFYRKNQHDVQIITFDELIRKAEALLDLLSSSPDTSSEPTRMINFNSY